MKGGGVYNIYKGVICSLLHLLEAVYKHMALTKVEFDTRKYG
jgi:hypothetical protein